jgi:NosR/NirI family transcriptional regulator, nitrous oxide reductase regulator
MCDYREKSLGSVIKFATALYIIFGYPAQVFAQAVERFPKPDFESGYTRPLLQSPAPRAQFIEYLDIFVLFAALSLASYFILKLRSRKMVFALMVFCLAYFGFYREGCICPVGSVQNMSLALFDSGYVIPFTAIVFFALPLLFALFFGRAFCAAVCPLGAIQDVVVLKPASIPSWLQQILGIIPYLYLGFAVLFASTGAGFIICKYDPFVGFFRFGASFNMIVLGVSMLMLGTVVARPYCRFLCPYGVLLSWMSRVSKWHVTITPDTCIDCRLCEESCPFGAINKPVDEPPVGRRTIIKHLAVLILLLPVVAAGSGWVVSRLSVPLSHMHFTVSLAESIQRENTIAGTEPTDETDTFRASGITTDELFRQATSIRRKFVTGGWLLGGFLGAMLCVYLIHMTVLKRTTDYTADRGACLGCARCYSYCPQEKVRLGIMTPEEAEKLTQSSPS